MMLVILISFLGRAEDNELGPITPPMTNKSAAKSKLEVALTAMCSKPKLEGYTVAVIILDDMITIDRVKALDGADFHSESGVLFTGKVLEQSDKLCKPLLIQVTELIELTPV